MANGNFSVLSSGVAEEVAKGTEKHGRKRKADTMDAATLMRKRATDRKSQQAFRERTKLKIAALENEVARMSEKAGRAARELHDVKLQRDNLSSGCIEWMRNANLAFKLQAELDTVRDTGKLPLESLCVESERNILHQPVTTTNALPGYHRNSSMTSHQSSPKNGTSSQDRVVSEKVGSADLDSSLTNHQPLGISVSEEVSEISDPYELRMAAQESCVILSSGPSRGLDQADGLTTELGFEDVCFQISIDQTSTRHVAEIHQKTGQEASNDELADCRVTNDAEVEEVTAWLEVGMNS